MQTLCSTLALAVGAAQQHGKRALAVLACCHGPDAPFAREMVAATLGKWVHWEVHGVAEEGKASVWLAAEAIDAEHAEEGSWEGQKTGAGVPYAFAYAAVAAGGQSGGQAACWVHSEGCRWPAAGHMHIR